MRGIQYRHWRWAGISVFRLADEGGHRWGVLGVGGGGGHNSLPWGVVGKIVPRVFWPPAKGPTHGKHPRFVVVEVWANWGGGGWLARWGGGASLEPTWVLFLCKHTKTPPILSTKKFYGAPPRSLVSSKSPRAKFKGREPRQAIGGPHVGMKARPSRFVGGPILLWAPRRQYRHPAIPDFLAAGMHPLAASSDGPRMDGKARLGHSAVPQSVVDPMMPLLPPGCFSAHSACMRAQTCHHHYVFLRLPLNVDEVSVARFDGVAAATSLQCSFLLHALAMARTLAPSGTGASREDIEDDLVLEDDEQLESPYELLLNVSTTLNLSYASNQNRSCPHKPDAACQKSILQRRRRFRRRCGRLNSKMQSDARGMHMCAITWCPSCSPLLFLCELRNVYGLHVNIRVMFDG